MPGTMGTEVTTGDTGAITNMDQYMGHHKITHHSEKSYQVLRVQGLQQGIQEQGRWRQQQSQNCGSVWQDCSNCGSGWCRTLSCFQLRQIARAREKNNDLLRRKISLKLL